MKTNLSIYNNSWYQPGSLFKRISWYVVHLIFFNHSLAVFNSVKCFILRIFGGKIGKGVIIKPSVTIKYPWFLEIGDNSWIGEKVWIDNLTFVIIGNNVCISQGALILTGNHNYSKSAFDLFVAKILIEDGAWIGARSTVCPGIVCKTHSVLTVGSVATTTLESYGIYQGIPARKIKERKIEN